MGQLKEYIHKYAIKVVAVLFLIFIVGMIYLLIRDSMHSKKDKFTDGAIANHKLELSLFKSLPKDEQYTYMNMTRDEKIKKYGQLLNNK